MAEFWASRSTGDVVMIILALTVAVLVLLSALATIVLAIDRPDLDLSGPAAAVGTATSTMVAALVGYLAGRGRHV